MDLEPVSDARARRGGRAFHSRLEPFVNFIRQQRQNRKTWKEITQLLRAEKGCAITFQGVHQFYRRFVKRQARPHWERATDPAQPLHKPATSTRRNTALASTPPTPSFRLPPTDGIQLNDVTK